MQCTLFRRGFNSLEVQCKSHINLFFKCVEYKDKNFAVVLTNYKTVIIIVG